LSNKKEILSEDITVINGVFVVVFSYCLRMGKMVTEIRYREIITYGEKFGMVVILIFQHNPTFLKKILTLFYLSGIK